MGKAAILALDMWPFTRRAPSVRPLERRLDELEDDVLALQRRFESLRGSVTGAVRRMRRPDPVEEDEEDEVDEVNDDGYGHAIGAQRRFGKIG